MSVIKTTVSITREDLSERIQVLVDGTTLSITFIGMEALTAFALEIAAAAQRSESYLAEHSDAVRELENESA